MTMTMGPGKKETTALICSALSASSFISGKKKKEKQMMKGKETRCRWRQSFALPVTFKRSQSKRTGVLQELARALDGDERALQRSEVELQHSGHRVQVVLPFSQGILSCRRNRWRTASYY